MEFKPLSDRILVRKKEEPEMTESGLYIPSTASHSEQVQEYEVVAMGSGRLLPNGEYAPPLVAVGDKVLLLNGQYSTEVKIDLVLHRIVREDDILGVIED